MLNIYFNNIKCFCLKRKIAKMFNLALFKKFADNYSFEVGIRFFSKQEIKQLNKNYRNVDKETDVLSFPIYDFNFEKLSSFDYNNVIMLGDIAICKEIASMQAKKFGHSLKRELCFLALHGFLHLLGFDHIKEEDEKVMKSFSEKILKQVGVTR